MTCKLYIEILGFPLISIRGYHGNLNSWKTDTAPSVFPGFYWLVLIIGIQPSCSTINHTKSAQVHTWLGGITGAVGTLTLFTSRYPDLQAAASALDDSLHPVGTKAMPPCLEGKNSGIYFSEPPAEQARLTPHLRPHPCLPPPTLTFRAIHTVFLRIIPSISFMYGIPISGSASGKPDLKPRQEL